MTKAIRLIGVPMDLGQDLRGVNMGPDALRHAGLAGRLVDLGYEVHDYGNVNVAVRDTLDSELHATPFVHAISLVCERLYDTTRRAIRAGYMPLIMGGDHSSAIGTVGGTTHDEPAGLLWIDAHGDYNTPETSLTGNVHGMPLAVLRGFGPPALVDIGRPGAKVAADDVVLIALRKIDRREREMLRNSRMTVFTMREIDEQGMAAVANESLRRLEHHERIHVSLDMDSVDPIYASGVGTPVPGGLDMREAHLLMELLADDGRVASIDVVEVNPILDNRNQTAILAVDLVASLLGQAII